MKVVPAVIAEVKRIREIFLDHHGVPISQEFVDFANAIGNLCDAALALALASAAVDVPVEAPNWWLIYFEDKSQTPEVFNDEQAALARFENLKESWACHLFVEAQGKPDARPVIGPNTYRGEDGSVSVLGTSTELKPRTFVETAEHFKKVTTDGPCAVCKICGGCTRGHIHCRKCRCTGKPTAGRDK